MNLSTILQSKTFKGILYGIGITLALLVVFQIGVFIGFKKASFSYKWGENYHRNFGGPPPGFVGELQRTDVMNSNGVFGEIIQIDPSSLIIKGPDGVEKSVSISSDTEIKRAQERISVSDLQVDDLVVVIGSPNDSGQIEAKLIRVMPSPPSPGPMPPQPPQS